MKALSQLLEMTENKGVRVVTECKREKRPVKNRIKYKIGNT